MKVLTNSKWGADRSTMLRLYRSLIRSKIDYGSFIYAGTRSSYLHSLDPIHHQGIRLATGAFRTSPTSSLLCESGEPPLECRRSILMCNYVSKILPTRTHPCHTLVLNPRFFNCFSRRPKATRPLGVRFKFFIDSLGITIPAAVTPKTYNVPPWLLHAPECRVDLSTLPKGTTEAMEYKVKFHELMAELTPHTVLYTDGSKSSSACGYAVISSNGLASNFKINPISSIFTAELLAIRAAVDLINIATPSVVICSDSLSAIQSISMPFTTHPLVQDILYRASALHSNGIEVRMMWVPGHVGIEGNDKADSAAKDALNKEELDDSLVFGGDFRLFLRKAVLEEWQLSWDIVLKNKSRSVKKKTQPWSSSVRNSRREEVALTRLRIGHCAITHTYLFTREKIPPTCAECNSRLTVRHLLTECKKYEQLRNRYRIPGDLAVDLGDDSQQADSILSFLKEAELLSVV